MTVIPIPIYPDPLVSSLKFLRARLPHRPEASAQGVKLGIRFPTPKTLPFVMVRRVGGFLSGAGVDKARLDFHVYHRGEFEAQALTQLVRGLILQMPSTQTVPVAGAREFTGPGPADDADWPEASRYYFTVELTLRPQSADPIPTEGSTVPLTHSIGRSYRSNNGTVAAVTDTLTGDSEIVFDGVIPGATTDRRVNVAWTAVGLQSYVIFSSRAVTVDVNSGTTPATTLTIPAGGTVIWYTGAPYPNPVTVDVTALFVTNTGADEAVFKVTALVDATP